MSIMLLVIIITFGSGYLISAPHYKGPKSKHFNGNIFLSHGVGTQNFSAAMKILFQMLLYKKKWPKKIENKKFANPPAHSKDLTITFVGQSTFLIQVDGLNILTDPVFSRRASPFSFMGPKRVREPGKSISDLPDIDVILVSHNHYDHLDKSSVMQLVHQQKSKPPLILAPLGNKSLFKRWNIDATAYDLDWGDQFSFGGVEFFLEPCKHWSGRGISDRLKTLWGAFVIKTSQGYIYFAGDTGFGNHFAETNKKFGAMKLSLIPIGAYDPQWFMAPQHINPYEAVQAHFLLQSQLSIGMHFGTFQLTFESIDDPIIKLAEAKQMLKIANDTFITLEFGESRVI